MISKLKDIITILGPIAILFGFIKLNIVYNHFNIKIYNYLDFGEILTLFLPDILSLIYIGLFIIVAVIIIQDKTKLQSNYNDLIAVQTEPNFFRRVFITVKKHWSLLILNAILIIFLIICIIWKTELIRPMVIIICYNLIFFLFIILEIEIKRNLKRTFQTTLTQTQSLIIFIIFLLGINTVQSAYFKIEKIKSKPSDISFVYQNKKIENNKNFLFIGQTKGFVFLKNIEENMVYIFEKKNISSLKIRNSEL